MTNKLTLILMRHGKSGWGEPGVSDHDRKLTKRGKRDAKQMGATLIDKGITPDVIYSSSAKRARSTAKRVAKQCECKALDVAPELYHDGVHGALEVIAAAPADARCIMLVGHNPTMEELVARLSKRFTAMPTATVAVIEFDEDRWYVVGRGGMPGVLVQLWTPEDIKQEVIG